MEKLQDPLANSHSIVGLLELGSELASNKKIRGFTNLGVPFGGPQNKDSNIWGSALRYPYLGKLPHLRTCKPMQAYSSLQMYLNIGFRILVLPNLTTTTINQYHLARHRECEENMCLRKFVSAISSAPPTRRNGL